VHTLTKHVVFSGPEVELARALADAAAGGQVLMTRLTWTAMKKRKMRASDDPLVEHLGHFRLKSQREVSVYQLHPGLASHMPKRHFGPEALRNVTYLKVPTACLLCLPYLIAWPVPPRPFARVLCLPTRLRWPALPRLRPSLRL
jgi:hypothetical protein